MKWKANGRPLSKDAQVLIEIGNRGQNGVFPGHWEAADGRRDKQEVLAILIVMETHRCMPQVMKGSQARLVPGRDHGRHM
jgi:hypothetical protein